MTTTDRRTASAGRRADQMRREIGEELRLARLSARLSQERLGDVLGISRSEVGRIERGEAPWVTIEVLARFAVAVGLDLRIRAYPGGPPLRDAGHRALLEAFRGLMHPRLGFRAEVPLPIDGDQRAWDALVQGAGEPIGVEVEMALRDCQRVERRVALKLRDGGVSRAILLIADTRMNRAALRSAGPMLREAFPVSGPAAVAALGKGMDPGGSAIVVLRVPRPRH